MGVLIRGGGDLASGVAIRLHRAGIRLIITEIPNPLAVRRKVSFSEAVRRGEAIVESIQARLISTPEDLPPVWEAGIIPVLVDPDLAISKSISPVALVDARMLKQTVSYPLEQFALIVGLGPGFIAGLNCHAAIETHRGHNLGKVLWQGSPEADTGEPEGVAGYGMARVLRAPGDGVFRASASIGDRVEEGALLAEVDGVPMLAPFAGVLRGLLPDGMPVSSGLKVGDLDPRGNPEFCFSVSDKALAIGGGVLEALLTRPEIRTRLWQQTK